MYRGPAPEERFWQKGDSRKTMETGLSAVVSTKKTNKESITIKKLTKLLAMLLAVAMILSVLSGCNKTEPDPTEPEATGEPAAENT